MTALDLVGFLLWLLSVAWAFAMGFILGRRSCPPPANGNGSEREEHPTVRAAL